MAKRRVTQSGSNAVGKAGPESVVVRRPAEVGPAAGIEPDERYRMVAEAAYFRAERRGFAAGSELDDWIQAETEVDRLIQTGASRATRAARVA